MCMAALGKRISVLMVKLAYEDVYCGYVQTHMRLTIVWTVVLLMMLVACADDCGRGNGIGDTVTLALVVG